MYVHINSLITKVTTCDLRDEINIISYHLFQVMNDSFVLFWDVRNTNLLGGYWDTFGDEVTEVKFHPDNPDSLVSTIREIFIHGKIVVLYLQLSTNCGLDNVISQKYFLIAPRAYSKIG